MSGTHLPLVVRLLTQHDFRFSILGSKNFPKHYESTDDLHQNTHDGLIYVGVVCCYFSKYYMSFKTVETTAELCPYHPTVGTNIWDGPIRKWRKINVSEASLSGCSILKLLTIL